MANIASAEKQRRQAEKSKARNRAGKSALRTTLKKARTDIQGGDADKETLATSFSASSFESGNAFMKAPPPVFTSSTNASNPSASFLDIIDATISGMYGIVAVASRSA